MLAASQWISATVGWPMVGWALFAFVSGASRGGGSGDRGTAIAKMAPADSGEIRRTTGDDDEEDDTGDGGRGVGDGDGGASVGMRARRFVGRGNWKERRS